VSKFSICVASFNFTSTALFYSYRIKERIENFMAELDNELWKVGVMSKTKHIQ